MSANLTRALGLKLKSLVSTLNVYADDEANASHKYPYATLTLLTDSLAKTGCGRKTVKRTANNVLAAVGDRYESSLNYRITVNAATQEQTDSLKGDLRDKLLALNMAAPPITLIDTATSPNVTYYLSRLAIVGGSQVPPDYSGEPYVYRAALTVGLTVAVMIEKTPEGLIENIIVEAADEE